MYPSSPDLRRHEAHGRVQRAALEVAQTKAAPSLQRRLALQLQALAAWLEPELMVRPEPKPYVTQSWFHKMGASPRRS